MGRILYHYCSIETFESIIKNHTLRFADITKTNDSEELLFITEFYKQAVFGDLNGKWNSERYLLKDALKEETYYAFCVSDKEDDLSQWRGYAHDGGFAIGFDEDELKKLIEEQVVVKIDEKKQKEVLIEKTGWSKENAEKAFEGGHQAERNGCFSVIKYLSLPNDKEMDENSLELQKTMRELARLTKEEHDLGKKTLLPVHVLAQKCFEYKSKDFEGESESRLVFMRGKTSIGEVDVEDAVFVRDEKIEKGEYYYDIPFDFSMIKRIIIGPKINFLGQKSGLCKMVLDFLKENDTFCGDDETRNLSINEKDVVLTKLSYR